MNSAAPNPPSLRPPILPRALAALGLTGPARAWREYQLAGYEAAMMRYYLDAAKSTTQTADWKKISVEQKQVWNSDAKTARERAAYLCASTEYGHRATEVLCDVTVGTGIQTQCQIKWGKDSTVNKRMNNAAESAKQRWQENAFVNPGMHDFDGQSLWLGATITDGECFVYRRFVENRKVRGIRGLRPVSPLCYEIIPAMRLTSLYTTPFEGNTISNGIEYDSLGTPVAYWIEDDGYLAKAYRLPAEHILHHFRVDRPAQRNGITWFAPVVQSLFMLRDIVEYKLIQYKVQAALSVLVSDDVEGNPTPIPGLPVPSGGSKATTGGVDKQYLTPGMVTRVGRGRVTPFVPAPSADLDPLTRLVLRGIGVGVGLSYERLSGDYQQVSFAGGRLTENALADRVDVIHAWQCRGVEFVKHADWLDFAVAMGDVPQPPAKADPYACHFSRPRRRRGVNPMQEVNAAALSVEKCLTSLREEVEQYGGDIDDVLAENAELKEDARKTLGLAILKALDPDQLPEPADAE